MASLRRLLSDRAGWALLCLVVALGARLLVPSGYMVAASPAGLAVVPCSGTGPMVAAMTAMAHHGVVDGHGGGDRSDHGGGETPCPFAALAVPALGGADPVPLPAPVAWMAAPAWLAVAAPPARPARLRLPPSRGPPAAV